MSQVAKKTSISIPRPLLQKAKKRAKQDFKNNVSGYIQTLVAADVEKAEEGQ